MAGRAIGKIAMVFQSYALYPHMTVFKNIAFPLKAQGIPKADRQTRMEWAASMFNIERLIYRKPRALSGGERQRVALTRALVRGAVYFWGSLMGACFIASVPIAILYNCFLDPMFKGLGRSTVVLEGLAIRCDSAPL
jgi:ABC-type proline/glycine betaine transport system ATPase subunit